MADEPIVKRRIVGPKRHHVDAVRKVLRPEMAAAYLGLSRATLYRIEKKGELAPRICLGVNSSGWMVEDLDAFLASRPRGARQ